MAKTISLLASRMPVRLEVFLQFSFSNIVFMFLLYYTGSVFRSRNSRKAFKFLSKRLVLLLYENQYRHLCFAHKTTVDEESRGVELSHSACPGWGIDRQARTKLQIPGGVPGGGMVTGRIEPCIILNIAHAQKWSGEQIDDSILKEFFLACFTRTLD